MLNLQHAKNSLMTLITSYCGIKGFVVNVEAVADIFIYLEDLEVEDDGVDEVVKSIAENYASATGKILMQRNAADLASLYIALVS